MRPARKRQLVDEVRSVWQVSIRRACQALPVDRSTYHYRCKRTGQAMMMKRIKEIAETRVRYGYRRIHVLLRREGWLVNSKRVCRLYREMGLQLRNKSPKRRVKAQLREDRSPATAANQVWAMDFVHDQLFDGRKIRVLTIVDTFTRLSPAIEVRQNFRGIDVVDTLERVRQEIGCPKTIRLDNGPEFISKELDLWAFMRGVTLDFSRPGQPTDNAFIESLNGKFRAECLNANEFLSLDEAPRKCQAWRRDSNAARRRSGFLIATLRITTYQDLALFLQDQQGLSEPFRKIPTSKACRQHHWNSLPVTTMPDSGPNLDGIPSTSSKTSVSVVMPFAITDAIGRK